MILATAKNPSIELAMAVQSHSTSPREELGGKMASPIEGRLRLGSISTPWDGCWPPRHRAASGEAASEPKAAAVPRCGGENCAPHARWPSLLPGCVAGRGAPPEGGAFAAGMWSSPL